MSRWVLLALACALAGAGGFSSLVFALETGPDVTIDEAWVRAMPPGQHNTAAYLSVNNLSSGAMEIVGVSTDSSEKAEMHVSREVDGYTRMEQLETLPLPARETVRMSPGGIHLMLLGLDPMPAPGSSVRICLELSSGGSACVDAPVQKSATDSGGHQHDH
jgi:copper(I)-binding protein